MMKSPIRYQTIVGVLLGAGITFIVMAATRPEPHTLFVTSNQQAYDDAAFIRVLPAFELDKVPFRQAVHQLSEQAKTPVVIRDQALEAAGIDLNKPVSLRLTNAAVADVFNEMFKQVGPNSTFFLSAFSDKGGGIIITTAEDSDGIEVQTRIYDLRDLIEQMAGTDKAWWPETVAFIGCFTPVTNRPNGSANAATLPAAPTGPIDIADAGDWLARAIRESIGPGTWQEDGGAFGTMRFWGGRLVVTQTPDNHHRIEVLLHFLREAAAKVPPAK